MIRSKNNVVIDVIDTTITDKVYAQSELVRTDYGYMVITKYFRKEITHPAVEQSEGVDASEEVSKMVEIKVNTTDYTVEEIDQMFAILKPMINNLPYTEMVSTGIEYGLLDFLNNNVRFGVPIDSDGWEII